MAYDSPKYITKIPMQGDARTDYEKKHQGAHAGWMPANAKGKKIRRIVPSDFKPTVVASTVDPKVKAQRERRAKAHAAKLCELLASGPKWIDELIEHLTPSRLMVALANVRPVEVTPFFWAMHGESAKFIRAADYLPRHGRPVRIWRTDWHTVTSHEGTLAETEGGILVTPAHDPGRGGRRRPATVPAERVRWAEL